MRSQEPQQVIPQTKSSKLQDKSGKNMKVVSLQNQVKKKSIGAKSPTVTQQPYHTVVVSQLNHEESSQASTNSRDLQSK